MNSTRMITAVAVTLIMATSFASAQTTYIFDDGGVGSDWATQENWDPNGRPVGGDTAIIPAGKTCVVQANDQEAKVIELRPPNSELRVRGHSLTLGAAGGFTSLSIRGAIYLESDPNGPGQPRLLVRGSVRFSGGSERGFIIGETGAGAEINRAGGEGGNGCLAARLLHGDQRVSQDNGHGRE